MKRKPAVELFFIICITVMTTSGLSHIAARILGISGATATYRRMGPLSGPQVLCAGSSLLQFGIEWTQVSALLKQGIENWGVGNSSPEIWEVTQPLSANSNFLIVGLSVYDLNEHHLCGSRAHLVSVHRTIQDLWTAKVGWQFAKRVLSQYPLSWFQHVFPTAGNSDAVLVGLRRKALRLLGASPTSEDQDNSLVLPSGSLLEFGSSTAQLSDWSQAKTLRRLATQRANIQGLHGFSGPKKLALFRILDHAGRRGQVVVVVLPVAPIYATEFITPEVRADFEDLLTSAQNATPQSFLVRLDKLPALNSNKYFSDFVHLNGAGREVATRELIRKLREHLQIE